MRQSAIKFFAAAAFIAALVAFFRDTLAQGQDFLVFYNAAKAWRMGQPIYDLVRDGGMIFKYPPWTIPFFLPYSFLSVTSAKCAWAVTQILSLLYVLHWCIKTFEVQAEKILIAVFLFWGIWVTHFLDGQVTLVFMACTLACFSKARVSPLFTALAGVFLTTKIYSFLGVIPFFIGHEEIREKTEKKRRVVLGVLTFLVLLLVLTGFVLVRYPAPNWEALVLLFKQWAHAAASGVRYLGEDKVLGRANQSLTALSLRVLDLGFPQGLQAIKNALGISADLFLGGLGFLLATFYLISIREKVSREIYFAISLALIPVIHPLPWIHGFALAFPLFVAVFGKPKFKRQKFLVIFLLCIASRNTMGVAGEWLELFSAKGFGVLLLIFLALKLEMPRKA